MTHLRHKVVLTSLVGLVVWILTGVGAPLRAQPGPVISRTEPNPVCLGQPFAALGRFGAQPARFALQIRPSSPRDNRVLFRWRQGDVRWRADRLETTLPAGSVPPGRYRLALDTPDGFAVDRNFRVTRCTPTPAPPPGGSPGATAPGDGGTGASTGGDGTMPRVDIPTPSPVPGGRTPELVLPPEITGYRPAGACIARGADYWVLGRRFGAVQGSRGVALGGHGLHKDLQVLSWSDTAIHVKMPNDRAIAGGQWYYNGLEKSDHTGWLSNINQNITICNDLVAVTQVREDLPAIAIAPSPGRYRVFFKVEHLRVYKSCDAVAEVVYHGWDVGLSAGVPGEATYRAITSFNVNNDPNRNPPGGWHGDEISFEANRDDTLYFRVFIEDDDVYWVGVTSPYDVPAKVDQRLAPAQWHDGGDWSFDPAPVYSDPDKRCEPNTVGFHVIVRAEPIPGS